MVSSFPCLPRFATVSPASGGIFGGLPESRGTAYQNIPVCLPRDGNGTGRWEVGKPLGCRELTGRFLGRTGRDGTGNDSWSAIGREIRRDNIRGIGPENSREIGREHSRESYEATEATRYSFTVRSAVCVQRHNCQLTLGSAGGAINLVYKGRPLYQGIRS